MSLAKRSIGEIPEETAKTAKSVFSKGNPWIQLREQLGIIYEDQMFASLYSTTGQPALEPWRLTLVVLMQFAEGLSDRQAADAARSRLDWKYLLGLSLDDPGFHFSVLSEFRARLLTGDAETLLLTRLLDICREHKLIKQRGKQRTDATHVLAAARSLTRLELITTTLQYALNILATVVPEWTLNNCPMEWVEQYAERLTEFRLPHSESERTKFAQQVASDGDQLLEWLWENETPQWMRQIPAVETLRIIWIQQFCYSEGLWRLRDPKKDGQPNGAELLCSPFDLDARYSEKRGKGWVGYKAHFTETCDEDMPRLITQVTTTTATTADVTVLPEIQSQLSKHDCLPKKHLADGGYISASNLERSQREHQIELCGPPLPDNTWQARAASGFTASDFKFDWGKKQATCPAGCTSNMWKQRANKKGLSEIRIRFARVDCRSCLLLKQCSTSVGLRRELTIHTETEFKALASARAFAKEPEYKKLYAMRAGCEATISQATRRSARRSRYFGIAKTHLQNIIVATVINIVRLVNWLESVPIGKTPKSALAKLFQPTPLTA